LSGFSRTRGLLLAVALLLAFLKAARVVVNVRCGWRWRVRMIRVEGAPRGRRKDGIGVGILGCLVSPGVVRLLGWACYRDFVDAECNFWTVYHVT
jgi:hypothetical protein